MTDEVLKLAEIHRAELEKLQERLKVVVLVAVMGTLGGASIGFAVGVRCAFNF